MKDELKNESLNINSDPRFGIRIEMTSFDGIDDFHVDSRWSERHAAYACGLGTFGLSRGLITEYEFIVPEKKNA